MKLSENFTLDELTFSQMAVRRGLDNAPYPDTITNLKYLALLLEQVRTLVNGPIRVSSGYRSPAVNAAVGGSPNSAHLAGLAADITTPSMSPRILALTIAQSAIPYDQVINEFGSWVHFGVSTGAPRRQVLTATRSNSGVIYTPGISS